jgi:hypothetical protein
MSEKQIEAIVLSSAFRTGGDIENPTWILSSQINNIVGIKVKNSMIPLSVYTFDNRNNKMYIVENNDGITLTCTIPEGIYTSSTLPAVLKTSLEAVGALTYSITYSAISNKISYSSGATPFKFVSGYTNAYYELGLTTADLDASATSITSSEVIDLSGVKQIHIVSNLNCMKVVGQSYNVLGSITTEEVQNTVSSSQDDSGDYVQTYISSLSEVSISLYDDRFRRLVPKKDYSLTLNFLTI